MAAKSRKAATNKQDAPEVLTFEGALEQLETTVGRLEEGEMPLEEALELFEKGVGLSCQCMETLEAAEKRIEVLVEDGLDGEGGACASEPFEHDEEDDDEDPDD